MTYMQPAPPPSPVPEDEEAGAYTRPLSGSTSAASDTKTRPAHLLLPPDTSETPPKHPLTAPPMPQKALKLS